jgi:hypothetical protein
MGGGTWPNRWNSENERSAAPILGVLPLVPREVGHAPLQLLILPDGVAHITNQLAYREKGPKGFYLRASRADRRCWWRMW